MHHRRLHFEEAPRIQPVADAATIRERAMNTSRASSLTIRST
jgi:hypothetical protein